MKLLRRKRKEASPRTNPALSDVERDSLQDTIRHAEARIAEIDALLEAWGLREQDLAKMDAHRQSIVDTSRATVLRRERRELLFEKQRAENRLRMPSAREIAGQMAKRQREQEMLEAHVATRRAIIESNVEKHEREGDHMQASIWRNELNGLRARIAAELGLNR